MSFERVRETAARWYGDLRPRYLYKGADAVLTSIFAPASGAMSAGSRAYQRVRAVSRIALAVAPGSVRRAAARLVDDTLCPFRSGSLELIGFGSGATVFRVSVGAHQPFVLKVFRKSLGRRPAELRSQLAYRQETYRTVTRWYRGLEIVPSSHFILLHGPVLSLPAVGCLQPFVQSRWIDLLHDLSESDLIAIVSADGDLGRTIGSFIRRTVRAAREERASIDLIGRDNVVLVPDGASYRLVLLDQGIYRFDVKATRDPGALAALHDRLRRLEWLGLRIEAAAAPSHPSRRGAIPVRLPSLH